MLKFNITSKENDYHLFISSLLKAFQDSLKVI